jgi:thiol-disulfide isomerase/thioredoxin
MGKARVAAGWLAGCLLLWGGTAGAAPDVSLVLKFRPHQEGIVYTIPTPQEEAACKVELEKGQGNASGWLLRDAKGQPLRRFYDSNGDGKPDVWSYFKDGVEVYREIDTNFTGKPDQYRWLNSGGSKWGVDDNKAARPDFHIDHWRVISAEEVSQEVLQALITKDFGRLERLLITDAEVKALELAPAEATRIRELHKNAPAKFQAAVAKLASLNDKTHWLHLETAAPQTIPADPTRGKYDIVKYAGGTILCETNGKNEWIQTGEIIQAGPAWRLIDAPVAGLPEDVVAPNGGEIAEKELQPLLDQLNTLDKDAPHGDGAPGPNPALVAYNLKRADILEKIVAQVKPEKREPWIRQVADSLSSAAQSSPLNEKVAYNRLVSLEDQLVKGMAPGSPLAGYVTFREMTADYTIKLSGTNPDFAKVQEAWLERLAKFVQTYPRAEDTPDALLQLGMVSEFLSKEIEAKKWYQQLATNFADKPQAAKGAGALKRLDLEGKPLELAAPALADGSTFDVAKLHGKVVIVYYWASWNQQCVGDFAKLKLLLDTYGAKGVDLVSVNLDTTAEEAKSFLTKAPAPGTHLFQAGGLESPLATQYGILGLPNLFLVGKDGKVVSRTVQITTLETEIQKQLK